MNETVTEVNAATYRFPKMGIVERCIHRFMHFVPFALVWACALWGYVEWLRPFSFWLMEHGQPFEFWLIGAVLLIGSLAALVYGAWIAVRTLSID